MTKQAKMVTRIRKLLALAESSNMNEAATAAGMANKLMREHAISMSSLSEDALLEQDPVEVRAVDIGKSTWAASLAWALGSHCKVSVVRGTRHGTLLNPWSEDKRVGEFKRRTFAIAYGHRSDLEVWEYLYSVAKREIQRLTKTYRTQEINMYGYITRTEATQYREGLVGGLGVKLKQMKAQASSQEGSNETALALQSRAARARAEMERENPRVGSYSGGCGMSAEGYRDGHNINLNPGLQAKPGALLLGGE